MSDDRLNSIAASHGEPHGSPVRPSDPLHRLTALLGEIATRLERRAVEERRVTNDDLEEAA